MKAALTTEGNTTTQRALSKTSCGISSGTSRISFITRPALATRSFSSFSLAGLALASVENASTPAIAIVHFFIFVSSIKFEFLLAAPQGQNRNSTDHCNDADYGGNRYGLVFFFGRLYRSDVQHFLVRRISETLVHQRDNPNHDQGHT